MNFNEKVFLYALSSRPEDARRCATTFKPEWLSTTEYIPILAELYAFTRKHGEQPSINTLHTVFKDKDEDAYNLRYKAALDSITEEIPDRSAIIYTLDKARDTGIARDFSEMINDQNFMAKQADLKGSDLIAILHKFFTRHGDASADRTMDLKQAVDNLIDSHGFMPEVVRIPTGIKAIDEWCGGGLRTKQQGIILAPTGEGKSVILAIMAHNMATVEQKRVWIVTNELTIEEQTERLLSRITGTDLTKVINDPAIAFKGLERHWRGGLHDRLRITEVNREVSMDDIEAEMAKWVNMIGWKPDVLILDFLERMKPCDTGYRRDQGWDWIGAISRDVNRFDKRNNILTWTAGQTNRSGLRHDTRMGLDMAQGSIKHLQEAYVVIGARQIRVSDDKVVMELTSLKQRQSKGAARPVCLECDLSKMHITNTVYETTEFIPESSDDDSGETPRSKQRKRQKRSRKVAQSD